MTVTDLLILGRDVVLLVLLSAGLLSVIEAGWKLIRVADDALMDRLRRRLDRAAERAYLKNKRTMAAKVEKTMPLVTESKDVQDTLREGRTNDEDERRRA